jgi:hypothetical protein
LGVRCAGRSVICGAVSCLSGLTEADAATACPDCL